MKRTTRVIRGPEIWFRESQADILSEEEIESLLELIAKPDGKEIALRDAQNRSDHPS